MPLDLEYRLSDADRALASTRLGPTDRPLRLGVNVAGSSRLRYWGNDNFIACIRWMREFDPRFAIWVGGAPDYQADVEAIAGATGAVALPPLASFHEFAAGLREFDLLLTPDTSVVHLAAAWKTPLVGLFRESAEGMPWYPYRAPFRAAVHVKGVPSVPLVAVEEALRTLVTEQFPGGPAEEPAARDAVLDQRGWTDEHATVESDVHACEEWAAGVGAWYIIGVAHPTHVARAAPGPLLWQAAPRPANATTPIRDNNRDISTPPKLRIEPLQR